MKRIQLPTLTPQQIRDLPTTPLELVPAREHQTITLDGSTADVLVDVDFHSLDDDPHNDLNIEILYKAQ